jgi:hypothetical protein
MAWLSGWSYRKSITLSRASGAVTNYQMMLKVGESSGATGEDVDCGSKCQADFDDIRFTKSDGTTLLDYWIESTSGSTPNGLANIWIEFDSIGTGATTFYMYYGKADATAVSNGPNTFPFFDHFADSSVSSSLWTLTGTPSETGTILTCTNGQYIAGKTSFSTSYAVRTNSAMSAASGVLAEFSDGSNYCVLYGGATYWTTQTSKAGTYRDVASATSRDTNYHIAEVRRNQSTSVIFMLDGATLATESSSTYIPTASIPPFFGRWAVGNSTTDWILVRYWLTTEPAWGSWGAEETPTAIQLFMSHYRRFRL